VHKIYVQQFKFDCKACVAVRCAQDENETEDAAMASKGTTDKPMTLSDAMAAFLGPLHAEYCRLIDEWAHDAPVQIILGRGKGETTGGYIFQTTMGAIQDLDRAHQAAFEAKQNRAAKKAIGSLL
jgi:hypothetical protein